MPSTSQLSLHELHYNLAHVLHQQRDLAGAAESYRQALALQPDYVNAHLNLAIVLDEQGQFHGAVHHYRQAIALQPDLVQAYNNLGCTLAKLKEFDAAIQSYQQAIDLNPHWATPYNNLGQALQSQGKSADAIEAYRRAIELQPDLALAHYNLGKVLQAQGHHARAATFFQQALQIDPDYLSAYSDCGASWMAEGNLKQALPYLREATIRQHKFVAAYWQWAAELGDRASHDLDNSGDSDNPDPSNSKAQDPLTQARVACGQFLYALHHQPDSPALYDALARTYLYLADALCLYGGEGQYRQAQTYYQSVLQLQPNHLKAYLGLGDCLVKQEKHNAATLIYHLALTLCPNPAPLHVQLGQTLEQQQKFAEAIVHYRQALQGGQSFDRLKVGKCSDRAVERSSSQAAVSALLPQGISPSTQDWLAATYPNSTHYIHLSPPHPPIHPSTHLPGPQLPPLPQTAFRSLQPHSPGSRTLQLCHEPSLEHTNTAVCGHDSRRQGLDSAST